MAICRSGHTFPDQLGLEVRAQWVPPCDIGQCMVQNLGHSAHQVHLQLSPHLRRFTRRTLTRVIGEMGFEIESLRWRSGSLLLRAVR